MRAKNKSKFGVSKYLMKYPALGFATVLIVAGCLAAGSLGFVSAEHSHRGSATKSARTTYVAPQQPTSALNDGDQYPVNEDPDPMTVPVSRLIDSTTLSPQPAGTSHSVTTVAFGGHSFRFVRTLRLRVTAYAPDPRCCWPYDGKTTASGVPVTTNGGKLAAADISVIPFHSMVVVPGYAGNVPVPVLDRGGAIKGNRLDILLPTYDKAKAWGVRMLDVKIYSPIK